LEQWNDGVKTETGFVIFQYFTIPNNVLFVGLVGL